jgi:hypothetical protein
MNRITKGENARTVLRNANKLQRNRTAKQRLEVERKQQEQKQAQQRKDDEKKAKEKRSNVYKARGVIAKELQKVKELDRSNRVEFMRRVEKGESQNTILRNMSKRIKQKKAEKEMKATKPTANPLFKPNNSKFPATNNPLAMVPLGNGGDPDINGVRPRLKNVGRRVLQNVKVKKMTNAIKKNREEAARRGVSTKKAQRNRQQIERENAEAKSLREKVARNKAEAERARAKAKANLEAKKRAQARAVRDETERRRLAMLEKQKKKDAKAEFRKANRKLARATGQGVKATQKKQQQYRRRKK